MIKLQIKELCIARGFRHPLVALTKAGISHQVSYNYLRGAKRNLSLKHIEMLCTLFRCTPNDLFAWTPDNATQDYPENPLQAIREQPMPDLQKVIGNLSFAEVKKRLEAP